MLQVYFPGIRSGICSEADLEFAGDAGEDEVDERLLVTEDCDARPGGVADFV